MKKTNEKFLNKNATLALEREYKRELKKLHKEIFNIIEYWVLPLYKKDNLIALDSLTETLGYLVGDIVESKSMSYLGNLTIQNIFDNEVRLIDSYGNEIKTTLSDLERVSSDSLTYSKNDSFTDRLNKVKHNINIITNKRAKIITNRQIRKMINSLNVGFKMAFGIKFKDFGFNKDMNEKLKLMQQNNISLIKSIPSEILESLDSILYNSSVGGDLSQIKESLQRIKGISNRRIETIARDQTSKGLNAISTIRATQAGFEFYKWVTAEDERVSKEHKRLNGKIFRYDTPEAIIDTYGTKGHPSQRVNCRCIAAPIYLNANQKVEKVGLGYKIVEI
ncbi:hypothetical protein CQA66_08325 [Helicobacter aurati]|uniref:Phage head morphogenesis domain-containing protein n=1 Tax=Helicobacter aurati TaxID=137778 RepID=A0A3D8J0N6_9HELI|nr:phage minor head protein [Helicobacter aurati]RDU70404.1 hypothetical protein CQA66_08325 [Helicobacter aurati]